MSTNKILKVELGERGYDIVIGQNLINEAGEYIKKIARGGYVYVVTDENVATAHLKSFKNSLKKAEIKTFDVILKPGEKTKSFKVFEKLLDSLFELKTPERKSVIVAFGGGVIGDLTGFAASVLMRGVDFIQIPTTLLSQVDSSVGGKTGINNKFGKNLIGAFYQPRLVLADIYALNTLPKREFLAGYAEVVKYGLLGDKEFFNWLENNLKKVLAKDVEALKYIIHKSCEAKADIVARDEKESDVRALLNLGHTFGHALEQQMGYSGKLLHGEAVAIGMVFAFFLSEKLGYCSKSDVEKVTSHLKKAGLPVHPSQIKKKWDVKEIMEIISHDKKVVDGKVVFILVKGIGDAFIEKSIDRKFVSDTIKMFLKV